MSGDCVERMIDWKHSKLELSKAAPTQHSLERRQLNLKLLLVE
jgi:hypothetical protein